MKNTRKQHNRANSSSQSVENCLKFLDCVSHKFCEQSENNIILYVEMQKETSTTEKNTIKGKENIAKMKRNKKKTGRDVARKTRKRKKS